MKNDYLIFYSNKTCLEDKHAFRNISILKAVDFFYSFWFILFYFLQ